MKKRTLTIAAAVATLTAASGVTALSVVPSAAQDPPPPIAVEELTRPDPGAPPVRGAFTDDVSGHLRLKLDGRSTDVLQLPDPSHVAVARITVQPGAQFPWHTHPGPVIVTVVQGELIYVNADDCVHRPYPAGTTFVDPGRGNVHTAYNPTDAETVVVATFFDASATGPLTITDGVAPPDDCDVGGAAHDHG